jgi:hypothetical protein
MPSRRPSYAWALHPQASRVALRQLSDDDHSGLAYAEELARDARPRSNKNLRGNSGYEPLTIDELAARDRIPASTIRRRIRKARRQLFGELTDNAIYKRLQRQHQRGLRPRRRCEHPGCEQSLHPNAHANRRFCDEHRTPAARVRRHRQRTS